MNEKTENQDLHEDDDIDNVESDPSASATHEDEIEVFKKGSAAKRPIDTSNMDDEEIRRLEARRAYNRHCAAKARKRSKDLISHLQEQVAQLSKDKADLERANEVMKAQMELLEQQNRTLMLNQRPQQLPVGSGTAVMVAGLPPSTQVLNLQTGNPGSFPVGFLDSLSSQGRIPSMNIRGAPTLSASFLHGIPRQMNGNSLESKYYQLG